jgi:hypothetical protein
VPHHPPRLLLGPLLRHTGPTEATLWVETDRPCTVEALGASATTFAVEGHHYALLRIGGLAPGTAHAYRVHLDGAPVWPVPGDGLPPSVLVTPARDAAGARIAFGSCRVAMPHTPPHTRSRDDHPEGFETDVLAALAGQIMRGARPRPDVLLMIGDQVYVDEGAPETRDAIRARRDTTRPPGPEAACFEEYTLLYHEAWRPPAIRWLLANVPTAMVFDDHEVHDDWNISESWLRDMWRRPWWEERITGAFMSYWVYQHLGNLSPADLDADPTWARVLDAGGDAGPVLREAAGRWCRGPDGSRWSHRRDIGRTRIVVVDTRAGRVLRDGRRDMLDEDEWGWLGEQMTGGVDHLLVASSLPVLMLPSIAALEAWNERVCAGAWGRPAARASERLRRALDLEHWPAFDASFRRLVGLVREVAAGRRGAAPATVLLLGGDVHHAYLATPAFRRSAGVRSRVAQIVCSPMRNPLGRRERRVVRAAATGVAGTAMRLLARSAGWRRPEVRWRLDAPPAFDNQLATIETRGRRARLRIECTRPAAADDGLTTTLDVELA